MDTLPSKPTDPWAAPVIGRRRATGEGALRVMLRYVIPVGILVLIAVGMISGYLVKRLWMGQLHYSGIFWTLLSVQWTMFAVAFVVVFLFVWINLRQASRGIGALNGGAGSERRGTVALSTPAHATSCRRKSWSMGLSRSRP